MHRSFYSGPLEAQSQIELDSEESHHLINVLRHGAGESFQIVNGKGTLAIAELTQASAKKAQAVIKTVSFEPRIRKVSVCFGIPKSTALEFVCKRLTEVGVAVLQPLQTQHSLSKDGFNSPRCRKWIQEAAKQCQESWFPEIHAPLRLSEWLHQRNTEAPIAFLDEEERHGTFFDVNAGEIERVDLLVGPEGGWHEDERRLLKTCKNVWHLGLGKNRLRAETAALVGASILKLKLNELSG